jgi:ATP-dependent Clp protease protease subunit
MTRFWNFKKVSDEAAELRIDGDIVDDSDAWIYEWFDEKCTTPNAFREELANHTGKDLTVWVDSYGGNVFAAAGIYNALRDHKGKVTVKIDGKAMSAATVIAMAGDTVQMSPVGIMMIHNPLTYAEGYASDLRKTADVLDTVKETIVNAYQLKTGLSRNKISQMMDDETYMSAKQALKDGFIDEIMFTDEADPEQVFNFAFNRRAILNSTNESIKRMIERDKPSEEETTVDNSEELQVIVSNSIKMMEMEMKNE